MSYDTVLLKDKYCQQIFDSFPEVYNCNTPEKHPIIFSSDDEYQEAITLLAICAKLFPGVKLLTFQVMSNHLHFVAAATQQEILALFGCFVLRLSKSRIVKNKLLGLNNFKLSLFKIDTLEYLRNAIAYTNRNGFVVNENTHPFSYRWGANSYFFQPIILSYDSLVKKPLTARAIRTTFHGRGADSKCPGLYTVDGTVSPLSFCDIPTAESLFRNARHYFHKVSKAVESYNDIGKILSESFYLTDDDLFTVALKLARDKYNCQTLQLLTNQQKIEMSRTLHYDYNAASPQLHRLLRIPEETLNAMFR